MVRSGVIGTKLLRNESVAAGHWVVRMSATADRDVDEIVSWTLEQFGEFQARSYEQMLTNTVDLLRRGPGVRARRNPFGNILSLRVQRTGKRGRHIVFFRVIDYASREIEVIRILHDSMDFRRHLP